ncbi:MAG: hypothetical protein ACTSU2_01730 [Promethearchaeota archaeon]
MPKDNSKDKINNNLHYDEGNLIDDYELFFKILQETPLELYKKKRVKIKIKKSEAFKFIKRMNVIDILTKFVFIYGESGKGKTKLTTDFIQIFILINRILKNFRLNFKLKSKFDSSKNPINPINPINSINKKVVRLLFNLRQDVFSNFMDLFGNIVIYIIDMAPERFIKKGIPIGGKIKEFMPEISQYSVTKIQDNKDSIQNIDNNLPDIVGSQHIYSQSIGDTPDHNATRVRDIIKKEDITIETKNGQYIGEDPIYYFNVKDIIPPRSYGQSEKEVMAYAKLNYTKIDQLLDRLLLNFQQDARKYTNVHINPSTNKTSNKYKYKNLKNSNFHPILIINDLTLYFHSGDNIEKLNRIIETFRDYNATIIFNAYYGSIFRTHKKIFKNKWRNKELIRVGMQNTKNDKVNYNERKLFKAFQNKADLLIEIL